MGLSGSTIKNITEPIDHLLNNCSTSDCHSKCCDCFEFDIEHHIQRTESRDSNISLENKKSSLKI